MNTLWNKKSTLHSAIADFTTKDDLMLDQALVRYDCLGSIAHAYMLSTIEIITPQEFTRIKKYLVHAIDQYNSGNYAIFTTDEDIHTAIENYLTQHLADVGKKIHTARSRNDQIMLDLRLYMRDHLLQIADATLLLIGSLLALAEKGSTIPMPGRTHFQPAMPSSFGLWAGAFAESLLDTVSLIKNSYTLLDQSPLGSAAGYGVNIHINRQLTAELLGFGKVQNNVLYASNSRGKFESIALHAATQIMQDLSKIATDLIIFSCPEFDYVEIPQELCTGSSLMPQKKNPDALELTRAKAATVSSYLSQTLEIVRALPSGYNRDFQQTKGPMMHGLGITLTSLHIIKVTIDKLIIKKDSCIKAMNQSLYATDYALELVKQGIPFRQAYHQISTQLDTIPHYDPHYNIEQKKHVGATGNLGLETIYKQTQHYQEWVTYEQERINSVFYKLIEIENHD